MCNDSTYWLAFCVLIASSFSFVIGRFYERADCWLRDRDAERRAVKAAVRAREALLAPARHTPRARERFEALGRGLAQVAMRARRTTAVTLSSSSAGKGEARLAATRIGASDERQRPAVGLRNLA